MQFINQTGKPEDDPEARQTIRRHVMLGKNRGKRPPKPKRSVIPGAAVLDYNLVFTAPPSNRAVPRRIGSDLSFLEFADSVEGWLMSETLQFCSATNEHMYVLEPCISFGTYDPVALCLHPLATDALYMNTLVFSTKIYRDIASQNSLSQPRDGRGNVTLQHYGKAITILKERVAESPTGETLDVMIMAVILLALHALIVGHATNAQNHAKGMARMIPMQEGGLDSYKNKSKQLMEILRCDLSIALAIGTPPLLDPLDLFEDKILPSQQDLFDGEGRQEMIPVQNPNLSRVWRILKHFCAQINKATIQQRRVSDRTFLHFMAAIMYGASKAPASASSNEEPIRLAILCLSASAFLQWRQVRVPLPWLQRRYKDVLARLPHSATPGFNPGLVLWLLLIYGVSFYPLPQSELEGFRTCLAGNLRKCELSSWEDVKAAVGVYPWIDIICDQPARVLAYEALDIQDTGA